MTEIMNSALDKHSIHYFTQKRVKGIEIVVIHVRAFINYQSFDIFSRLGGKLLEASMNELSLFEAKILPDNSDDVRDF